MPACIPITQEQIRAELWLGATLLAKTPFISSFNVSQARGQLSGTFSVTFEMLAGTQFPIGQRITIKAGTKGNLKSIYTGFIETTKVSPAHAKPSYFSVNLGGQGVLSQLENKRFTRRLKSDGQGMFCLITQGSSNRPSSVVSLDRTHSSGNRTAVNNSPNPASVGGEHSQFTRFATGAAGANAGQGGGAASILARSPSGGKDANSNTGLGFHTHEDLDNGGPSFGVYSAD